MDLPLHTRKRRAVLVGRRELGVGLVRLDLRGDGIGRDVEAGRFAMLEAPGLQDAILLRPYSYFLTEGDDVATFLVRAAGRGSGALAQAPVGSQVGILGPLGNRFPEPQPGSWIVVGGVGAGAVGAWGRLGLKLFFGARTASESGFAEALADVGFEPDVATDDGTRGYHGTVVARVAEALTGARPPAIYTIGPTPMMRAMATLARQHDVECWVSLEARMGCGFGVCRGCVQRDAAGAWRCICETGPVYRAEEIFAA